MTTMTYPARAAESRDEPLEVTAGVDTHKDTHTAAALDQAGRLLGHRQFPATAAGYTALLTWLRGFEPLSRIGVEGTGVYGAGLARHRHSRGIAVVEVDRPDRKTRRWQGKSDPVDAEAAARAALAERATGVPKQRDGRVEALLLSHRATRRPDLAQTDHPETATVIALRSLARRHRELTSEINDLEALIAPLVTTINPTLLALNGVGPDVAGQLLITAGENPERLRSEAAFAMFCGAAPLPASSGRTHRHANCALHRITLCRLRWDPTTRAYAARRTTEGMTKKEIIRCLKRYVARDIHRALLTTHHGTRAT